VAAWVVAAAYGFLTTKVLAFIDSLPFGIGDVLNEIAASTRTNCAWTTSSELIEFFKRSLLAGKVPAELRGQATVQNYTRYGGWFSKNDRLADPGAENALQQAMQEIGTNQ
jgi:hypothetical protein